MAETISLLVGIIGTAIAIYQFAVIHENRKRKAEMQFLLAGIGSLALSKQQAWNNQISWLPKPQNSADLENFRIHSRARDDFLEISGLVSALEGAIDIDSSASTKMLERSIKHGELNRKQIPRVFTQFHQQVQDVQWFRNMDLSVNGHVSDAEQWVTQTLSGRGLDALHDELAADIAWHINSLEKCAKDKQGKKRSFYPAPLFVEDGLFRFANKLGHYGAYYDKNQ